MAEALRLLLVEDDPDIAQLAMIALEEIGGFVLRHCSNGSGALAILADYRPDAIILDYRMPGMNGDELLGEIRKTDAGRDIPIIFMTASLMPGHVKALVELGALGVIAKPFDPITLPDQVRELLGGAGR